MSFQSGMPPIMPSHRLHIIVNSNTTSNITLDIDTDANTNGNLSIRRGAVLALPPVSFRWTGASTGAGCSASTCGRHDEGRGTGNCFKV